MGGIGIMFLVTIVVSLLLKHTMVIAAGQYWNLTLTERTHNRIGGKIGW